ncbi:TPA: hypothetical protein DEP21_05800 [Patescibacteria group bacterium]|nr:hypothetical protein [Candidatus Gracilibacteria bacterium]
MKNSLSSKVRNTVTGVMILSGILGTTKSALAQNLASNSNTSTNTGFNNTSLSIASTSALGVIKTQIKNFPQDLQAHYQNCLDKLYGQEEIDAVNNLLNEHIFKNITDPQEQVVWAIECLETVVLK